MQPAWKVAAYVFWVGAATAGAYLLMTTYPGKGGALFLARPQAQLWVLALAAQAGLWASVTPFLWRTCREFRPASWRGWVGWLLLSAVVVLLFVRLERAGLYGPVQGIRWPIMVGASSRLVSELEIERRRIVGRYPAASEGR